MPLALKLLLTASLLGIGSCVIILNHEHGQLLQLNAEEQLYTSGNYYDHGDDQAEFIDERFEHYLAYHNDDRIECSLYAEQYLIRNLA